MCLMNIPAWHLCQCCISQILDCSRRGYAVFCFISYSRGTRSTEWRLNAVSRGARLDPDCSSPDLSAIFGELPRGQEIDAWLRAYPTVSRFLILDDLPHGRFRVLADRLVRSEFMDGFSDLHLNAARRFLED
jgi:hypothetical protein